MGDSTTAMTIEFLRARLLSERAVSKAAKERADQLAKRIVELEEQLSFVVSWRKEAEKEAMQALSILEAYGMDDPFVIDSSTDTDEVPNSAKGGGETLEGDEAVAASKTDMNDAEDANSSSEHGGSLFQAGSLSWKSCSTSPDSQRKLKANQLKQLQRRLSLISCATSSPKYNLGKSCRKIKHKETGFATKDQGENTISLDACEHREMDRSDCDDDQPDLSVQTSGSETCPLDAQNNEAYGDHHAIGSSTRDEEMERLLEQQAQLIGQYEAEEKAQQEWEEKYNENKNPNVDYSGQGNQSLVAENDFEEQKQSSQILSMKSYEDEQVKMTNGVYVNSIEQVVRSLSDDDPVAETLYHGDQEMTDGGQGTNPLTNDIVSTRTSRGSDPLPSSDDLMGQVQTMMDKIPENDALDSEVKKNQSVLYDNSDSESNIDVTSNLQGHINFNLPSTLAPTSDYISNTSRLGSSNREDHHQSLESETATSSLEAVLEALQRAKITLRKELQRFGRNNVLGTTTDYQAKSTVSEETLKIPVGSAGLFRLPTDAIEPGHSSDIKKIYASGLSLPIIYCAPAHATTPKFRQYPITSYADAGSSDLVRNISGMSPASSRYPLAYSDVNKEQIRFSYGSEDSHRQHFRTNSRCKKVPASTLCLPSDLTAFGNLLDGYEISGHKKESSNIHLGVEIPHH